MTSRMLYLPLQMVWPAFKRMSNSPITQSLLPKSTALAKGQLFHGLPRFTPFQPAGTFATHAPPTAD